MGALSETLVNLWQSSGFSMLFDDWRNLIMIVLACVLLYLGIVK